MPGVIKQSTVSNLDWSINWANRGLGSDVLVASQWSVTPTGLTLSNESFTGATTTVWLSGGVAGGRYTITNNITTSGGREMTESLIVNIVDPTLELIQ